MNSEERRQLVKSYSDEHAGPPRAQTRDCTGRGYSNEPASLLELMLKCGVCLALVLLLVVMGSGEEKTRVPKDARSNVAHPASVAKSSGAAAHRKEVLDDRRARFEGTTSTSESRFAAAGNAPADPAMSGGITDATCSGGADGGMDANGSQCSNGVTATR